MFTVQSIHVSMELWAAIFCVIMAVCLFFNKGMSRYKRTLLLYMELSGAVLVGMDACAWAFRGYPGTMGYWMVRISNFMVFFMSDVILLIVHEYVCMNIYATHMEYDGEDLKHRILKIREAPFRVRIVYYVAIVGMMLVIVSQFTNLYYYFDEHNFYHRNTFYFVSLLVGFIAMAIDASLLIQNRTKMKKLVFVSLLSYLAFPFLAAVCLVFYYGISLLNISIVLSFMCIFVVAMIEQGEELRDTRAELMVSQMQPHFIYNALTAIKYLCKHDPEMAAQTIDEFSGYLRGNIDSLTEKDTIPFEKELEHTRNYLAIEKKRFAERLNVTYQIETENFMIPPLTLQPIAENAVKHGICKKKGGGTLSIHVMETEHAYQIIVSDDGVGFDANVPVGARDGRKHIGIENVRERVKQRCRGTLKIESIPGKGTVVTIEIPKKQSRTGEKN